MHNYNHICRKAQHNAVKAAGLAYTLYPTVAASGIGLGYVMPCGNVGTVIARVSNAKGQIVGYRVSFNGNLCTMPYNMANLVALPSA